MTLLHAQGVAFRHAGASDFLFQQLNLALATGDRLAVVGSNGCGKSSLLALLAGRLPPTEGQLWRRPGLHLAALSQAPLPPGPSLLAVALSAHRRVGPLRQALDRAEAEAEAAGWSEASALAHAEALDAYGAAGAWALEAEAAQVLAGLGLPERRHAEPTAHLSGGEGQRLALARLLLAEADLLLLDEPSNHLDGPARRWLKAHLAKSPTAVAFASHDRELLGAVADRVLSLSRGAHRLDSGGWAAHLTRQAELEAQAWAAHAGQQRRFAQAEAQYAERLAQADRVAKLPSGPGLGAKDFYWAKAARVARTAKILRERPLREAPAEKPRFEEAPSPLRFPSAAFQAEWPLVAEGLALAWGERQAFAGLDLALQRGQKLGLVGPNGAGKSSLLALLAGRLAPQAGRLRLASRLRVAWVGQEAAQLDLALSPAALAAAAHPDRAWGRTVLGALRLRGRLAEQPLSELSHGQRLLVAIALAMLGEAQVLLLDEPSNHLDLAATEALEQSLASYPGACVVASHDLAFLGAFAEGILHLDGQGGWGLQSLADLT